MLLGLTLGFMGAIATIAVIDSLERGAADDTLDDIVGTPDLDRYCGEIGMDVIVVGGESDQWRCAGRVNGFFTVASISVDDVCREQFQHPSRAVLVDVTAADAWRCVALP